MLGKRGQAGAKSYQVELCFYYYDYYYQFTSFRLICPLRYDNCIHEKCEQLSFICNPQSPRTIFVVRSKWNFGCIQPHVILFVAFISENHVFSSFKWTDHADLHHKSEYIQRLLYKKHRNMSLQSLSFVKLHGFYWWPPSQTKYLSQLNFYEVIYHHCFTILSSTILFTIHHMTLLLFNVIHGLLTNKIN